MANSNPKWFNFSTYMANKLTQLKEADADTYGSWDAQKLSDAFAEAGFVGQEGAYEHFQQYGNTSDENVSPNPNFIAKEYYIFKAASYYNKAVADVTPQEAASIGTAIKEAGMSAWQHYIDYGTEEGINPSNNFDTNKYLQAKADALNAAAVDGKTTWTPAEVAKAISDAGMNALSHAMEYADGTTAGEAAAPFNDDGSVIDAYKVDDKADDGGEGQNYALTAGVDSITPNGATLNDGETTVTAPGAGDDTINGVVGRTISVIDTIDLGGGNNTANLIGANLTATAANLPQLNNVQVVNFEQRDVASNTFDASLAANMTEFNLTASQAGFEVTNATTTTKAWSVKGLTADTQDLIFTYKAGQLTGTEDAFDLTLDGIKSTTGTAATDADVVVRPGANNQGVEVVNITATGANQLAYLNVSNQANAAGGGPVLAANATMTTLNITGEGTLKVANNIVFKDATGTINAGTNSGGVDLKFDTAAQKLTFTGSSKADTLTFDATKFNSESSLNGGDGDDTLSFIAIPAAVTTIDKSSAAGQGKEIYDGFHNATSFENLGLTSATALTFNVTDLAAQKYVLGANATSYTASNTTNGSEFEVKGATVAQLTLQHASGAAQATVDLTSTAGAGAQLTQLDTAGTTFSQITVNSTGNAAQANTIGLHLVDKTAVTITGDRDLAVTYQTNPTTEGTISASGFEGKLTVTGSTVVDHITTGSGKSLITLSTGNDDYTLGSGKDIVRVDT